MEAVVSTQSTGEKSRIKKHGSYHLQNATLTQKAFGWTWLVIWCSLHYISPLMLISLVVLPIFDRSTPTLLWCAFILALTFWPHRPWPAARRIFRPWFELFNLSYVLEVDEKMVGNSKLIVCWQPHGIVPITSCMGFPLIDIHFNTHYGATAVASIMFYLPILRSVFIWCGAIPSTGESVRACLRSGRNVSILPGGLAELFLSSREEEVVFMKERKSIVRIAMKENAKIIPAYTFGNTQHFDQLATGNGFFSKLSRKMRMSLTYFWGRYYLPIPYLGKSAIVLGRPIDFPEGESEEELNDFHRRWIESVQDIYERYKHLADYPKNKMLSVV
eukprot:TRINITY_DN654_c0_g2_i4.p1 TRINITY_DN654_c0_g2~~TRINITY_DN654_c0_g2_i4.p1  ORF type:complete len:331 (+),score=51.20 TRINITY_DN654_c0_g2_i4:21-1013(+)